MCTEDKRDSIIEKINKLLAVTAERGATQAEAIQAALKAQKLIAEYEVEDYELGGEEKIETIENIRTASIHRDALMSLANTVANNFRCHNYIINSCDEGKKAQ